MKINSISMSVPSAICVFSILLFTKTSDAVESLTYSDTLVTYIPKIACDDTCANNDTGDLILASGSIIVGIPYVPCDDDENCEIDNINSPFYEKVFHKPCDNDMDCANNEVCQYGECTYACNEESCGSNTICSAIDHVPICACARRFNGDPYGKGCTAPPSYLDCKTNEECSDHQICHMGTCVSGCNVLDCGEYTICSVVNHSVSCRCFAGYEGDAYKAGCVESS